ncbi:MAG: hypothetical protein QOF71_3381 [Candidatus Eremiobacteraeota bacterium]|nr:hypothetical protein [Candidatus Eremiobacteraeota bacterium]
MLVSRCNETTNPVVLNRLIAEGLLDDLRSGKGARANPLGVASILDLLDMYRSNNFYEREPTGILERADFDDLNALGESDGFRCLETVLRETHEEVLAKSSIGDFVERANVLLTSLLAPGSPEFVQNVSEAERFLSVLTSRLKNAEARVDAHA